ncbi:MAG: LysR family transcriptional regulator [Polyangiaceae bacterium]
MGVPLSWTGAARRGLHRPFAASSGAHDELSLVLAALTLVLRSRKENRYNCKMVLHQSKMSRWDDLRLFLVVARSGTLSAAADELGLNASTLHRRLGAFEAEMGSTLFEKGPRGYRLTNAGEALLPQAEEVEEAVFAATRSVVGHDQQASGEVRITLPLAMVAVLAPHLVAFCRAYDRIRPVLQADDVLLDLDRSTDVALRATPQPPETATGRDLCGLAWCRYASVATRGEELPWIHYVGIDRSPAVQWRKRHFGSSKPVMLVQGVMGMHAVLAGSGAQGLLPCFLGDRDRELRRLGEPIAATENRLWLLIHADLRRSARVRTLVDFLVPRLLAEKRRFEGG